MGIDFVITWVDMDDPKWKKEFYKYSDKIDNSVNELSEARFRDYGFLKYWLSLISLAGLVVDRCVALAYEKI